MHRKVNECEEYSYSTHIDYQPHISQITEAVARVNPCTVMQKRGLAFMQIFDLNLRWAPKRYESAHQTCRNRGTETEWQRRALSRGSRARNEWSRSRSWSIPNTCHSCTATATITMALAWRSLVQTDAATHSWGANILDESK